MSRKRIVPIKFLININENLRKIICEQSIVRFSSFVFGNKNIICVTVYMRIVHVLKSILHFSIYIFFK